MASVWSAGIVVLVVLAIRYYLSQRRPLPPGPRGIPLIGNLLDIPKSTPSWFTYSKWSKDFNSPLITFSIFGRRFIVLNTYKAALDLLESKGSIYSDRPHMIMAGELLGRKDTVFFVSSERDRFRQYRRILQSGLNPRAVKDYIPLQTEEVRNFLKNLLRSPEKFRAHIRRNAGAVILKLTYGYPVKDDDDYYIRLADELVRISETAASPGWAVDSFPVLRFIPSWVPGVTFKRLAIEWRKRMDDLCEAPFHWTQTQISDGTAFPSFTSKQMDSVLESTNSKEDFEKQRDLIMWVSGGLYAAGTDTTSSIMSNLFLVMALHPDVQRRAQAELDRVLGATSEGQPARLPEAEDCPRLPYVSAVIKEIHRWIPAGPLALPHRVTCDDEYEGYHIPAGTTILTNRWQMLHDEEIYPDPMVFNPDRFLSSDRDADPSMNPDPEAMAFGFGRRSCPGIHFATNSIFLGVASTLATFNISKAIGPDGKEIEPRIGFETGIVAHVKPFECTITPRSATISRLVEDA